jgi:hypothetical protein
MLLQGSTRRTAREGSGHETSVHSSKESDSGIQDSVVGAGIARSRMTGSPEGSSVLPEKSGFQ